MFTELPDNLPVPTDDGACDHLMGLSLPSVQLVATNETLVNLSTLPGRTVLFCYPRTGRPGQPLPSGWDEIPGARGCTPQSCGFRDRYQELLKVGVDHIFGLSTQETDYQREAAERLHLPYLLLSDSRLAFAQTLRLPTFEVEGMRLIRRITIVADDARIVHVFYPVFPPDQSAAQTLAWLRQNPGIPSLP